MYHITSRGDRREDIFDDDDDRLMWLEVLAEALETFDATVFAWCLMSNHYHIVLRTRRANLSRLMRHLNGVYTQRYNRRHGKVGHLYQGRFKGILVQEDAYLLEVCRYVDLNPVRAHMVEHPGDWPWSSYPALAGEVPPASWHDRQTVLAMVAPNRGQRAAQNAYARFVAQGSGVNLWQSKDMRGQIILGDERFATRLQARLEQKPGLEVPATQRRLARRELPEYFATMERDAAITAAFHDGGYTQTAIAEIAGLSISRVSRILGRLRAEKRGLEAA